MQADDVGDCISCPAGKFVEVTEEVGLEPQDIDIIVASLGNSLASVGGVCMGTKAMNASSKLNSSGYVFSASLPPFLAVAAQAAIDKLDAEPQRLERLQANARLMRRELGGMKGARVLGNDERSPLIHIEVDHPLGGESDAFTPQRKLEQLERIVDAAILPRGDQRPLLHRAPGPERAVGCPQRGALRR